VRLPIPRYLRHSPWRAMRERMWFVSRLQPQVQVTVNVARSVREQTLMAPPSTVFLHHWLAVHTTAPGAVRWVAAEMSAHPGAPLLRMSPLGWPRAGARPASVVIPVVKLPASSGTALASPGRVLLDLAPRLAVRALRIDDLTPNAGARMVTRGRAGAVSETQTSSREAPGWPHTRRGSMGVEPFAVPGPATIAVPPVNVEALTDQVLKQLDRRLIASRERLGRI
jgi:hypothetical protein